MENNSSFNLSGNFSYMFHSCIIPQLITFELCITLLCGKMRGFRLKDMQDDKQHDNYEVLSDHVGHSPTESDNVGHRPTMSDTRSEAHILTAKEVSLLLEQAGVSRHERSIERYCKLGKLDCYKDPDEDRYYITSSSAEKLIGHLTEIQQRHAKTAEDKPHPTPSHEPTATASDNGHSATQSPPEANSIEIKKLQEKIAQLENENFILKVDNEARNQLVGMIREPEVRTHLLNPLLA
jgi:hypothetical protein